MDNSFATNELSKYFKMSGVESRHEEPGNSRSPASAPSSLDLSQEKITLDLNPISSAISYKLSC